MPADEYPLFAKCLCGHDYGHHSTKDDHCCKRDCACPKFTATAMPGNQEESHQMGQPKAYASMTRLEQYDYDMRQMGLGAATAAAVVGQTPDGAIVSVPLRQMYSPEAWDAKMREWLG